MATTLLSSLLQCWTNLSIKNFFLISNLNLSLHNFKAFSLVLLLYYLGEKTNPHLTTTSSLVVVDIDKISTKPPFLQD